MDITLHEYQRQVVRHIIGHPGCGIFLGMGLGKTSITLAAVQELMYDRFEIGKVLIIAPKIVAESTWEAEAKKWDDFRRLRFARVLGTKEKRIEALAQDADIYLINRENVVWLAEYYRFRLPFDMLIIDESTSFKDAGTKRWRALKRCRGCFSRAVLLTGTPSPNSLIDLWPQLYLVDGGERLGRTLTEYRNRYFVPDKQNGPVVYSYRLRDKAAEEEIYRRISDICISLEPPKAREPARIIPCDVTIDSHTRAVYDRIRKEYGAEIAGHEVTAFSAAAVSNKLQQAANGAVYDAEGRTVPLHDGKLWALHKILTEEPGEPALVFYHYKSDLERIRAAYPEARTLDGPETVAEWNAGRIPVLLAHPASAGYGLNLQQGGHIIVWYGLTWSLEQWQQANARLDRQGQTEPVKIYVILAKGTIDEKIFDAVLKKKKGQDAMLEAVRAELEGMK